MQRSIPIVDAHLDLADNALAGRDLTLTAAEMRSAEDREARQAMVSLPELERGGIAVVFASVTAGFMSTGGAAAPRKPEEAEAQGFRQIDLYESWARQGRVRLIKSVADLDHHLELWRSDRKPGLVMLMEGAEPILDVRDLPKWWRRGLRIIALTWGDTKYGSGVAAGSEEIKRGGLTPDGIALLAGMAEMGFAWDIAHLHEDGVRQGLEAGFPHVCASHANARALTPTNRHLSDDVIRAVAERDGVVGIVLYNSFLDARWEEDKSVDVTLEQVRLHAEHIAELGGWNHVGIGSDLDGGFGLEETPVEIDTEADLYKIGSVIPAEAREGVLGKNWLDFLRRALPPIS